MFSRSIGFDVAREKVMRECACVSENGRILVIEADGQAHAALTERLRAERHAPVVATDVTEALGQIVARAPDLVLVDQQLSDRAVIALLERIRTVDPDLAVVLLTATGEEAGAVEAMKQGAADYLLRPLDLDEVSLVVARELERRRLTREIRTLRQRLDERYLFPGVIGEAPAMQRLFKALVQTAAGSSAVLITGEAGTGKTLIAGAIHARGRRGPLVTLTAGDEVEACYRAARGGSLFVEEMSDLPPMGQLQLVRLLERQDAMTDAEGASSDVRMLVATRCPLNVEVDRGRFRQDLQQWVSGVHVHVPALRERPSDVPVLTMHFLQKHATRQGRPVSGVDREALARLSGHSWPDNVRQLENVLARAVMAAAGPQITSADLPPELRQSPTVEGIQIPGWTLDQLERYAILETLKATKGSTTRTARMLGISVRNIQYKLRAYRTDTGTMDLRRRPEGGEKVA
jgi:two-component system response regulator HydG